MAKINLKTILNILIEYGPLDGPPKKQKKPVRISK